MITRQDLYRDLFKIKSSGVDITPQLRIMESKSGIPQEIIEFLQDKSPQFQFYRDLKKNQRALMKNILKYESLDNKSKIKLCSSLITRAMISVEYKSLDESLLNELQLDKVARAVDAALSKQDHSKLDEVLQSHKSAIQLFIKKEGY